MYQEDSDDSYSSCEAANGYVSVTDSDGQLRINDQVIFKHGDKKIVTRIQFSKQIEELFKAQKIDEVVFSCVECSDLIFSMLIELIFEHNCREAEH